MERGVQKARTKSGAYVLLLVCISEIIFLIRNLSSPVMSWRDSVRVFFRYKYKDLIAAVRSTLYFCYVVELSRYSA